MKRFLPSFLRRAAGLALCLAAALPLRAGDAFDRWFEARTLRVDLTFAGDSARQAIYLDELSCRPGWAGRRVRLDSLYLSGNGRILLRDEATGRVIYRHSFSTLFQEWQATEERCSFKAKGFTVKLRMEEREAPKHVKIVGDEGGVPVDFAFWIQLHTVSDTDTRMRLVLHVELNMMMKMMLGSKLQGAIDQIAEGIANAMNQAPMY